MVNSVYYAGTKTVMKRCVVVILVLMIVGACSTPKPYYKTAKGKKKQKYYNEIQFGGKSASEMRKY
jgi:hypothetical protein